MSETRERKTMPEDVWKFLRHSLPYGFTVKKKDRKNGEYSVILSDSFTNKIFEVVIQEVEGAD